MKPIKGVTSASSDGFCAVQLNDLDQMHVCSQWVMVASTFLIDVAGKVTNAQI